MVFSHDAGLHMVGGSRRLYEIGIPTLISIVPTLISIVFFNFIYLVSSPPTTVLSHFFISWIHWSTQCHDNVFQGSLSTIHLWMEESIKVVCCFFCMCWLCFGFVLFDCCVFGCFSCNFTLFNIFFLFLLPTLFYSNAILHMEYHVMAVVIVKFHSLNHHPLPFLQSAFLPTQSFHSWTEWHTVSRT